MNPTVRPQQCVGITLRYTVTFAASILLVYVITPDHVNVIIECLVYALKDVFPRINLTSVLKGLEV